MPGLLLRRKSRLWPLAFAVAILALAAAGSWGISGLSAKAQADLGQGSYFVLEADPEWYSLAGPEAMASSVEIIRKRIDALGLPEPVISREGDTRIVVQVPGVENPNTLRSLLGQTGELAFKLADYNALPSDVEQGLAPPGSEIVSYAPGTDLEGTSIAVRRKGGVGGDFLVNAEQGVDPYTGFPVIHLAFNGQGSSEIARITRENVGRHIAIILDGQVLSTPMITEPILGGQLQISGGFTVEGAGQLAIALRSGALPMKLKIVEQGVTGADTQTSAVRTD